VRRDADLFADLDKDIDRSSMRRITDKRERHTFGIGRVAARCAALER